MRVTNYLGLLKRTRDTSQRDCPTCGAHGLVPKLPPPPVLLSTAVYTYTYIYSTPFPNIEGEQAGTSRSPLRCDDEVFYFFFFKSFLSFSLALSPWRPTVRAHQIHISPPQYELPKRTLNVTKVSSKALSLSMGRRRASQPLTS